jgi:hypothetical protein
MISSDNNFSMCKSWGISSRISGKSQRLTHFPHTLPMTAPRSVYEISAQPQLEQVGCPGEIEDQTFELWLMTPEGGKIKSG